jgi:hypothetical protein
VTGVASSTRFSIASCCSVGSASKAAASTGSAGMNMTV